MATLAGHLQAAPPDQEVLHIRVTGSFDRYGPDYYPYRDLDGALAPGAQVRTVNLPVSQQENPQAGVLSGGFGWLDWYDRIHLIPGVLALGNLVSAQERTIEVWNAHFVPKLLYGLSSTGADGLTLTEPVPPPTQFGALESRIYTLAISLEGPPTIDALYTWQFTDQEPTLRVTGARVIGYAFRPNGADPFIERLQWRTDVITARDGTEQRIALRSIPRREFEFSAFAEGVEVARRDALLWGWGARVFALPVWTDPHTLTAQLPAGATSITVPTQYMDYAADGLAILWRNDTASELVEVLEVLAGSITIKRPTEQTWPAGTLVLPARLARLADSATMRRYSSSMAQAQRLRWRVGPLQPLGGIEGPAPTQYRGEDAYFVIPIVEETISDELSRVAEWIDGETGLIAVDDPAQRPELIREYVWKFDDRESISAFKQFLLARKGRAKPVWIPTFTRDLELAETLGGSATVMVVQDTGYRRYYAGVPGRQDVAIRLADGTWALRRITAADQVVPGQERLTLDSALGEQIEPGAYISLVGLHRLDTDQVEMAWITTEIAEARARLRVVPA